MNRRAAVLSALLLLAPLARPALAGIDQWTRVGPDTGLVRSFAAAPSRPATVYAGLSLGGVFRSLDHGESFARAAEGIDFARAVGAPQWIGKRAFAPGSGCEVSRM